MTEQDSLPFAYEDKELELDYDQADAVYLLYDAPVGVVTGGPGRGKTRCVQAALPLLRGQQVALCAPTGKAAKRMAELTHHPASTVHRMLGLQPGNSHVAYHRGNPLPYDLVIVDEASTLDNEIAGKLFDACDPERTRVILIGDVDQLPSVGAGQILNDFIESGRVPVVRLKTMHRAAEESWVCQAAPGILEGYLDLKPAKGFVFKEADEDLIEKVVATALMMKKEDFGEYQVIVPMNVGDYGANILNASLQLALNSDNGPSFSAGSFRIRRRDPVVAISNDYERAVFNGETGVVTFVDPMHKGEVLVDFGDREVSYSKADAGQQLRLSYALSVHKMQGSEARMVVVPIHEAHSPTLCRKLLYTAITRAKEAVVLIGQKSAVQRALSIRDLVHRTTTLCDRIERA